MDMEAVSDHDALECPRCGFDSERVRHGGGVCGACAVAVRGDKVEPNGSIDVEAAVERAAIAGIEIIRQQLTAQGLLVEMVPGWESVPEQLKIVQRNHVRPIVLAALDLP